MIWKQGSKKRGVNIKAQLIPGTKIALALRESIAQKTKQLSLKYKRSPKLAVILVGDDPASQIYVSHKEKACNAVGIESTTVRLSAHTQMDELLTVIDRCNEDDSIDGILLQLPIPKHLDRATAVMRISQAKDVDGLTDVNQGRLCWKNDRALFPCTPLGVMELIRSTGISIPGKVAAVLGRSVLVGGPLGTMLEHAGATVINIHSGTIHPEQWTRQADIVVVATGVKSLVKGDWIKPGAVVIDVGIHREGSTLVGDVAFEEVAKVAGFITPVPGGVGPMTIAMLLSNCLVAFELRQKR